MMKKRFPSVSIIIATFNSDRTIRKCLTAIASQEYEKEKIEIVIADGGSKDKTLEIVREFRARIINIDPSKQNAEYNKGMGVKHAKNEIVLLLDHDNIMPHNSWLKNMIEPLNRKDIASVEPLRFHYDKSMTLLDRYIALFGGSDPIVYYFGKNSHLSWSEDEYNLYGSAKDMGEYYMVTYSSDKIPALGGNGAAFRKKDLEKYGQIDPEVFIHTDIAADLIRSGHNKYALIKDTIIHLTNNKVMPFLLRRKYFVEKYQLKTIYNRRYKIYDPKEDKRHLLKYILISLTLVIPLIDSVKGYIKVRDIAWFLHPFMCLAFLMIYSLPVVKGGIRSVILEK